MVDEPLAAATIARTEGAGLEFGRTTSPVLDIVHLDRAAVTPAGLSPAGVHRPIRTSAAN